MDPKHWSTDDEAEDHWLDEPLPYRRRAAATVVSYTIVLVIVALIGLGMAHLMGWLS